MRFDSNYRLLRRLKYLYELNPLPMFSVFYTKDIKEDIRHIIGKKINGKFIFRTAGDFYFCYRFLKNNKFFYVSGCTRYSRLHDSNTLDFKRNEKTLNYLDIIRNCFTIFDPITVFRISNNIERLFIPMMYLCMVFRSMFENIKIFFKKVNQLIIYSK